MLNVSYHHQDALRDEGMFEYIVSDGYEAREERRERENREGGDAKQQAAHEKKRTVDEFNRSSAGQFLGRTAFPGFLGGLRPRISVGGLGPANEAVSAEAGDFRERFSVSPSEAA